MPGSTKNMFKSSKAANRPEFVESIVDGTDSDGNDKVTGYRIGLGNGYYLDKILRTKEEAETYLAEFLKHMEARFAPSTPTNQA